jgi:ribonuclease VapC
MIIDSSAVIAILRNEPDAQRFAEALAHAPHRSMSAASYLEIGIIVDVDRDPIASRRVDEFLEEAGITVVAVSPEQARIAREAYRDFGRGSGHPAKLNYGDCFSYALAKTTREPLLFKGSDFSQTDIEPALP